MEKKNYAASDITKHAMSASLKNLMAQKRLDKITIREITDGCGMKRQNFYYHFEDIYDLVKWMFQEEAVSLLHQHEGALLWQDGLLQLLQYLQENKAVCLCALKSMGHEHLKQFFQADVYAIIYHTVENVALELGCSSEQLHVDLLTKFYSLAFSGMLESWLLGEISGTPEEIVQFADTMLQDSLRGASLRLKQGIETGSIESSAEWASGLGDLK